MLRALWILIIPIMFWPKAFGLQCSYQDFKDVINSNKNTFLVSLISVNGTTVKLKVEKSYRGKITNEVEFSHPQQTFFGDHDLNTFKKGVTYLISTNGYEETSTGVGKINLYPCDLVQDVKSLGDNLKWLNSSQSKPKK